MMIRGRNLLEVYPQLLTQLRNNCREVAPRGLRVSEHIGPIMWTIERPWEWPLMIPGRRLNPFFALAEVVWMWSGKGGLDFIQFYNKTISQFADEGIPYFNASYGRRVREAGYDERPFREIPYLVSPGVTTEKITVDQLTFCIKKLKADPETRQAVISLWDVVKDNITKSKDHPCNNMVYFNWRGHVAGDAEKEVAPVPGKLNVTVVIRSNDLIWGVPYNMVQFVHLQALVAGSIGAEMGEFTVMCNNLHYYHDLYPETLESVLGWLHNLDDHNVKLGAVSDVFSRWDSSIMTWDLDKFDGFVRNIWDFTDKTMRDVPDNANEAWWNAKWMHLEDMLNANVPPYWQMVFIVMFMYHLRKAKAFKVYEALSLKLPMPVRWLLNDFAKKTQE